MSVKQTDRRTSRALLETVALCFLIGLVLLFILGMVGLVQWWI